jgi:GTPase Era involved in 16S rRNA processing
MQAFTVIGIGETGNGKSAFLNAYLQRNAFQSSNKPNSCTKITSAESNIIKNKILKAIDTPGIKDTDNTDQENVKQLVEFLLNYEDGINAVAIVLNGQNDKFTKDTEKFIKIAHQMFNHPDFWEHLCIIFTKWYSEMTEEQKKTKQDEYKKKVIASINKYTDSNINIDLPVFFVDSENYKTDKKTKTELNKFNNFVFSKNAMKTTQAEVPNVFYEKVIREERNNYRYKENLISEDGMKRTEYFANQSRNKLIDYYGNISYTNWKNEKEWEIVKTKTIEYDTQNCPVQISKEPRYAQREIKTDILGIFHFSQTYNQVVGESSNTTYEIRRRKKITDFDGKISYGDWEVIKTYSK